MKNFPNYDNKIFNYVVGKLERDRGNHTFCSKEANPISDIPKQNRRVKPTKPSSILGFFLYFLFFFTVTIAIEFVVLYNRPDLIPFITDSSSFQSVVRFVDNITISSKIREHSTKKNEDLSKIGTPPTSRPSSLSNEPRVHNFTSKQVSRAQKKVLESQKNRSSFTGKKNQKENIPIKSFNDNKHRYELQLLSGRYVYADSVIVTDDKITFENKRGLVVSVNRSDVKTLKKIN